MALKSLFIRNLASKICVKETWRQGVATLLSVYLASLNRSAKCYRTNANSHNIALVFHAICSLISVFSWKFATKMHIYSFFFLILRCLTSNL